MAEDKAYIEKRAKTRRDLQWDAAIVDSSGQVVSSCRLVNISVTGAQLLLQAEAELPEEFTLLLSHNGEVRRQCCVAWRDHNSVGVRFVPQRPASREAHDHSLQTPPATED